MGSRARYLRLPTAAPRPIAQSRLSTDDPPTDELLDRDDSSGPRPSRSPSSLGPFPPKLTLANRPRSESGITRPTVLARTREPSPTKYKARFGRTRFGIEAETKSDSQPREDDLGQNKLWQELKQVRGRSRPSTTASRSPSRGRP
jgi:hypothetical protein